MVHESRYDELMSRLVAAYRQVKVGDPLEAGTLMGPLIDAQAVERFRAAIAAVRALGGTIIFGGEALGCLAAVYAPPDQHHQLGTGAAFGAGDPVLLTLSVSDVYRGGHAWLVADDACGVPLPR